MTSILEPESVSAGHLASLISAPSIIYVRRVFFQQRGDQNFFQKPTGVGGTRIFPRRQRGDHNFFVSAKAGTRKNERSSADSLFRKGNAKLYIFHFEQHLVFILPEVKPEVVPEVQLEVVPEV